MVVYVCIYTMHIYNLKHNSYPAFSALRPGGSQEHAWVCLLKPHAHRLHDKVILSDKQ